VTWTIIALGTLAVALLTQVNLAMRKDER